MDIGLLNETADIIERIFVPCTSNIPAMDMVLTADSWMMNLCFGHSTPTDRWMKQVEFSGFPDPVYFLSAQENIMERLFHWKNLHTESSEPVTFLSLTGSAGSGKQKLMENVSFNTFQNLIYIDCYSAFSDKKFLTLQCNKLIRFCLFAHAIPVFINYDYLPVESIAHMIALVRPCLRIKLMIFLSETDVAVNKYLPQDVIECNMPEYTQDQQLFFWKQMAQKCFDPETNGAVLDESFFRTIVLRYSFTPGEIKQLLGTLRSVLCDNVEENQQLLIKLCQLKNTRRLGKLISYLPCSFTWDDIILPERQLTQLKNIADRLKYFHKVYSEWGFDQKRPYGQGISVLLSGPPGTGKTMAAQVIAAEAGMNLYRVEISTLVDKYIGETQKNINRVFDEAGASKSILLFDEADALFGKRVEQANANDRYSNQEIACLLQRIEQFTGLCLLTTNISVNIDPAFNRRFKFIINFPSPDPAARLALWKKAIPSKVPSANDIDYDYLSTQFELTGADIKNVVEAACFYAAKSDLKLSMKHIIQALADEIEKSGRASARYLLEPFKYIL